MDFRYTNGETPFRNTVDALDDASQAAPAGASIANNGSALGAASSPRRVARPVIETHSGEIRISTDLCWCVPEDVGACTRHDVRHYAPTHAVHMQHVHHEHASIRAQELRSLLRGNSYTWGGGASLPEPVLWA